MQIDGVLHEFSTVPGVREDVTKIILNLKKLELKSLSDEQKVIELDVEGPATVTADDLKVDADVQVLNPDQYICTIAEGGHLHMELAVKNGRGYVTASDNKSDDMPIGVIPVDSLFSPIKRLTTKLNQLVLVRETISTSSLLRFGLTVQSSLMTPLVLLLRS